MQNGGGQPLRALTNLGIPSGFKRPLGEEGRGPEALVSFGVGLRNPVADAQRLPCLESG